MTFSVFLTGKGIILSEMLADQCKNRAMYHSSKESHEIKWNACVDSQDKKQTRVVVHSKLQGTVSFYQLFYLSEDEIISRANKQTKLLYE